MIAAFFDGGRSAAERFLFRGRDLGFWIERSFPFCRFLDKPGRSRDDELILVFAHDRFPAMSEAGKRELRRTLQAGVPAPGGALTSADKPFFAVSRSFLRKNGIGLGPGIFRKLCAIPRVEELKPKFPATPIDPRREPLAVEAAVVALQIRYMQKQGVRFDDFGNFYMEGLPAIGRGSLIGPGVVIRGDSRIGRNAAIMANCFIENSTIGDNCIILPGSVILDSRIEKNVQLGPYCHVRLGSLIRQGAKIGNFVEMKKSVFGRGSKAMHLSYIGDAAVGCKTNIGAGTITCNYDGEKKSPTSIGDNVFIGSGTELVAPVTVHSDSYVAAGSTITDNVPRQALAIARQRQKNIAGWVLRKRKK